MQHHELHTVPGLPNLGGDVICFEANREHTALLVASPSQLAVVRLPSAASAARTLSGKAVSDNQGGWTLNLASSEVSVEATVAPGGLMTGTFSFGTGRRAGEFERLQRAHNAFSPSAAEGEGLWTKGAEWSGATTMSRPGELSSVKYPLRLVVTAASQLDTSTWLVHATLGEATLSLVDASTFSSSPDTIVCAAWHPTLKDQLVVLTRTGCVRIYATGDMDDLDLPIFTQRLFSASRVWTCVTFRFGASLACGDVLSECGPLAIIRRMALYVLCSNGAIVALVPCGVFTTVSPEAIALREALQDSMKNAPPNVGERLGLPDQLAWAEKLGKPEGAKLRFHPSLVARPAERPEQLHQCHIRHGGGPNSHVACSFAVMPVRNSPQVVFARSWTCGRVETLFGGQPLLASLVKPRQAITATPSAPAPGAPATPPPVTPVRPSKTNGLRQHGTRDSPLKGLDGKIHNALNSAERTSSPFLARKLFAESPLATPGSAASRHRGASPQGNIAAPPPSSFSDEEVPTVLQPRSDICVVGCVRLSDARGRLLLAENQVFPDYAIAVSPEDNAVYLLWVPILAAEHRDMPLAENKHLLGLMFANILADVRPSGPLSAAIVVEPGVGHRLYCTDRDGGYHTSIDLTPHCFGLHSTLVSWQASEETAQDDQNNDREQKNGPPLSQSMDELVTHFRNQLALFTRVPPKLGQVKVASNSTPPDLSLALCSWLHELSDGLMYGRHDGGPNQATGLMEAIRFGYEKIGIARAQQNATLLKQIKQLELIQQTLTQVKGGVEESQGKIMTVEELEVSLEGGVSDAIEAANDLHEPQDAAGRLLDAYIDKLEDKFFALEGKPESLVAAAENLESREKALAKFARAQVNLPKPGGKSQAQEHIEQLMRRTQELISKMADPEGLEHPLAPSVFAVSNRLAAVQKQVLAVGGISPHEEQLVTFIAFSSSPCAEELPECLISGEFDAVSVGQHTLSPEYQATVRRALGLDAVELPYSLPVQFNEDPTRTATVHIIILDATTVVELRGKTIALVREPLLVESITGREEDYLQHDDSPMVNVRPVKLPVRSENDLLNAGVSVCLNGADALLACQEFIELSQQGEPVLVADTLVRSTDRV